MGILGSLTSGNLQQRLAGKIPRPTPIKTIGGMGGLKGPPTNFSNVASLGKSVPPTPTPVPSVPQPPQAGAAQFGPGNDLRSTQISPTASPRLTSAQGMTDATAKGLTSFNRGNTVTQYGQQFGQMLAPKPLQFRNVGTSVGTGPMTTDVSRRAVSPNVGMRSAPQTVPFQSVNPNVAAGPTVNPNESTRLGALSNQQDQAVTNLTGGPNRTELAKQALRDFDTENQPGLQKRFQNVGREASKLGRIGAGMTTSALGDVETEYEKARLLRENDLARSVAEGDISDRFNTVNAVSGLRGQEEGILSGRRGEQRVERDYTTGLGERNYGRSASERDAGYAASSADVGRMREDRDISLGLEERNVGRDLALAGEEAGLEERNFGRRFEDRGFSTGLAERNLGRATQERDSDLAFGERDAGRDFDARRTALEMAMGMGDRESSDAFNRFGAMGDYERSIYGQESDARNEQRGERGYQEDLARYAVDNQMRQRQMEDDERQRDFSRGLSTAQLGIVGAGQMGGEAGDQMGAFQKALAEYMARQRTQPQGGTR